MLVYNTREHSKNKQDDTFCRDLFVLISSLFVFIGVTGRLSRATFCGENNIPCLRSQSWDNAQYSELVNQSNYSILGGSCVAYTKKGLLPKRYYCTITQLHNTILTVSLCYFYKLDVSTLH